MPSTEYSRAYGKGYNAASRKMWHANKPPEPPNEIIAAMMKAAKELRDEADTICASLMDDDEFVKQLSPKIDAVDASMRAVTDWLNEKFSDGAGEKL